MRSIYKFSLMAGENKITMPAMAKILHVGNQHDRIQLWAEVEVDTSMRPAERTFYVFATGEELPNIKLQFIGTVLLAGGVYVVHVYEKVK